MGFEGPYSHYAPDPARIEQLERLITFSEKVGKLASAASVPYDAEFGIDCIPGWQIGCWLDAHYGAPWFKKVVLCATGGLEVIRDFNCESPEAIIAAGAQAYYRHMPLSVYHYTRGDYTLNDKVLSRFSLRYLLEGIAFAEIREGLKTFATRKSLPRLPC